MARILFIVQGEGRGHLSQSIALKEYLEEDGHFIEAVYVGSNPSRDIPAYYRDIFKDRLRFFASPWFLRTPNKKGIYVGRTILINLVRSPVYLREFRKIRKEIIRIRPDVVVNFYDIVGAIAMRKLPPGIRRMGIGHHFFLHLEGYRCGERKTLHKVLLKIHTRLVMHSCDRVLALSFRDVPGNDQIEVVPPLIRRSFRQARYEGGSDYLVYLLSEGFVVELIRLARMHPELKFDLFSDLPLHTPVPEGISLHSMDDHSFLEKMKRSKGVITTAGFDTAAEAACMGLPLAVIPSENHFEQLCNCLDIEKSGLGILMRHFSVENLEEMKVRDQKIYRSWVDEAGVRILKHI